MPLSTCLRFPPLKSLLRCGQGCGLEGSHAAHPDKEQREADEDQGQGKADPQATDTHSKIEAEDVAERQADKPVGQEVANHGRARVAGAAQGPCDHGLDAVEELEDGHDDQQRRSDADHGFVGREDAGNEAWEEKESQTRRPHESRAEGKRCPAGAPRVRRARSAWAWPTRTAAAEAIPSGTM